jgi:hypothetical protein
MKKLAMIFILLALFLGAKAQIIKRVGAYLDDNKGPLSCMFVAGAADGMCEVLTHRYDKFKSVHPKANDAFWNPAVSWEAKKNKPMCTQWVSDGYHVTRLVNKAFIFGGCAITIGGKKRNWKRYVVDACVYAIVYNAGFELMWNGIYK